MIDSLKNISSFMGMEFGVKWHNEFGHLVRGDKLTLTNQV